MILVVAGRESRVEMGSLAVACARDWVGAELAVAAGGGFEVEGVELAGDAGTVRFMNLRPRVPLEREDFDMLQQ